MSVALRRPMTMEEFLAWEAGQELKYEFDGFGPVAMTGGTRAHSAIQRNLAVSLTPRLRGGPCQFYNNDLKVEVAGSIRYPDGMVSCTPGAPDDTVERAPVVVFEVLSPSTSRTDRIGKNREYSATPSVRRYVILEQDEVAATVFERRGADWIARVLGRGDVLAMPEIGIEVPLAELYDGIALDGDAPTR